MLLGTAIILLVGSAAGDEWRWPDTARSASVRIDTKVRFVDDDRRPNKVQADEIKAPVETEGFYNRPASGAGSGRYAVQSEPHMQRLSSRRAAYSDGTLETQQYCKCINTDHPCQSRSNSNRVCPVGQSLCCYKRPNRNSLSAGESGIFSELEDERPMLLPNHERRPGLFANPEELDLIDSFKPISTGYRPAGASRGILFGPEGPSGIIGPSRTQGGVLIGPEGPTGTIGPNNRYQDGNRGVLVGPDQRYPDVLVGPGGPSGVIGPNTRNPGVLTGPGGPTGGVGPNSHPNVLVGPEGPTGLVGPNRGDDRDFSGTRLNQPAALPGPDDDRRDQWLFENGKIGQKQFNQGAESAQVLVGPGGPTGMVGPGGRGGRGRWQGGPGVLVGPGGPTGIIGPGRRLLIGPGGPTGTIGPRSYGGFGF